jgi:NADPH-dependent ferric siderophore reductase
LARAATRLLVMARQLDEDNCPQKGRALFYDHDLARRRIGRSYTLRQVRKRFARGLGSQI